MIMSFHPRRRKFYDRGRIIENSDDLNWYSVYSNNPFSATAIRSNFFWSMLTNRFVWSKNCLLPLASLLRFKFPTFMFWTRLYRMYSLPMRDPANCFEVQWQLHFINPLKEYRLQCCSQTMPLLQCWNYLYNP